MYQNALTHKRNACASVRCSCGHFFVDRICRALKTLASPAQKDLSKPSFLYDTILGKLAICPSLQQGEVFSCTGRYRHYKFFLVLKGYVNFRTSKDMERRKGVILLELRDEEILAQVVQGDSQAYRELVVRHQSLIFTLCLKMLGDREEAQDAAQEVFFQAYQSLRDYQGGAAFRSWLYKIACNKCLDIRRKKARRASIASISPLQEDAPTQSSEPTPEEHLVQSEAHSELKNAVDSLPEKYRDVVVLYHYQHLSYKEIAEFLGIEPKSVETRMSRAKKMLRDLLRKEEPVHDELARRRAIDSLSGK